MLFELRTVLNTCQGVGWVVVDSVSFRCTVNCGVLLCEGSKSFVHHRRVAVIITAKLSCRQTPQHLNFF